MNKVMTLIAASTMMLLTSCATMGPGTSAQLTEIIRQVQATAVQACGFLPIASTIAQIVSTGQLSGVVAIADAICVAVTAIPPPTAGRKAAVPRVAGVPVHGSFVKSFKRK